MKIYRASGKPVRPADHDQYMFCIKQVLDKADEAFGKCCAANAEEYSIFVEDKHRDLTAKYPIYLKHEFPSSQKEMIKQMEYYGAPICYCLEDGKLVAYVMDV